MPRTVVVVDDEPELLGLVQDLLEDAGYAVFGVTHPRDLPALLETVEPNLFLLDIMLPGISGIELAQQLRTGRYDRIPIIGMSASRLMSGMAAQSGVFVESFDKPFDIGALLGAVDRHVQH